VTVLAVQVIAASLPAPIFAYVLASLRVVVKRIWGPSEVLLSVSIITFRPLMVLLVHQRAEGSLITVKHKLFVGQFVFKFVKVQSEPSFVH